MQTTNKQTQTEKHKHNTAEFVVITW